jgi:DNA processing protein
LSSDRFNNILPWFKLKSVPGVGDYLVKRLIDRFGTPHKVFSAPFEEISKVQGLSSRLAKAILRHQLPDKVKKELDSIQRKKIQITTLLDAEYPSLLREIPDPPPLIYVRGHLPKESFANIAIVGSRHATAYGLVTTQRLSEDLVSLGLTVVSGMAVGIDTAAHRGALDAGGSTIAVLGSGLNRIYPAENRRLFHRIAEKGAVISEFPLDTAPDAHNFPKRNRIISGMSLGTIVAEATRKSGSLITARLAAEQNREVFAVPGSIQSFKSTGTHTLIKEGAKLVEHAQDIIEELPLAVTAGETTRRTRDDASMEKQPHMTTEEKAVLDALEPYPVHIDDIIRKLHIEPGKLSGILLSLELKGIVLQMPGKHFAIA